MLLYDDLRPKRKPAAGYLPLFDDAALRDEPVEQTEVTPYERDSVLRQAGELAGGTVGMVGDALSAPGDYLRGVLAGKPGERVGGRDLLKSYGIVPEENNWGSFALGLAADTATDPLSFLSGPATALTKAGRAAKSLGLLDNAASVATKKAISSGAAAAGDIPVVAKRTMNELQKAGRKTVSAFDPAVTGRPLYGTRTARRAVTLDDLIRHADDPKQAEDAARRLLGDNLDAFRNERLADTFGLGLPLGDAKITGDWLGKGFGDAYADTLDTLGQAARWSAPGRYTASLLDNTVGGAVDAEEQLTQVANFKARQSARSAAANADAYNRARLYETTPDAFTEEGNRVMGRLMETPQDAWSASDRAWLAERPGAENYIAGWKNLREEALDRSRRAGLTDAELVDKYGSEYLPRKAEAALEMQSKRDRKLGDALSAFTGDMLRRTDAFQLPGGRDTIMDLSQDTFVSGAKRGAGSDEEAAQHIIDTLTPMIQPGQPPITRKQALRVARTLHALPDDVVKKAPLFGQHPVESIGSYLTGRAESEATMKTMYDSLATFAEQGPYTDKGRHISMKEALRRIGARTYDEGATGGERHIRERLARLWKTKADNISLADVSIPEDAVNRLTRARDAYSTGEAANGLMNWLDHYTQAWRGSILTWPSRAVRDLYSGAVSNWLEGAFDPESISAAKSLMGEGPDSAKFREWLSRQSRYAGDDGVARFYGDLAGTGLIQGPTGFEIGASTIGKRALDPIVGAQPINLSSIASELMPQADRSWKQFGKDFMTWRSKLQPLVETQNPIMRAGEKLNSLTDGINRISGYMALIGQGMEPSAAAAAMKRVHVDMTSLSEFERLYLKGVLPWYTYQSRMFREVLRQLVERPGGRFGQILQTANNVQDENDQQYIPSSLRAQLAIPLPEMLGGKPAPGTQRYWTKFQLPGFSELNTIDAAGGVSGTLRQLAMQTHPAIKALLQGVSGQDFFTDRPLGESTSTLDAIGRNVTGNRSFDVPYLAEALIENAPFTARPLYALRSLTDLRGEAPLWSRGLKTVVNMGTGTSFRDVSDEEAKAAAVRDIERSIDPYTREFKQVYIPKDMEPEVPPSVLRELAVSRSLSRERREARKPRKEQGKRKARRKSDTQVPSLFD